MALGKSHQRRERHACTIWMTIPELRLSAVISSINRTNRTCGDTEKRNEGNANPFRGDIIVLEILLVIIGGDKGTFGSCRNSVKGTREGKRENEYALMSGIYSDLEAVALGTEHAFIPCHPVLCCRNRSQVIRSAITP